MGRRAGEGRRVDQSRFGARLACHAANPAVASERIGATVGLLVAHLHSPALRTASAWERQSSEHTTRLQVELTAELRELDCFEPPLASLDVTDPGLTATQPVRQLRLREVRPVTRAHQDPEQYLVRGRPQCLQCPALAPRGLIHIIPYSDYSESE